MPSYEKPRFTAAERALLQRAANVGDGDDVQQLCGLLRRRHDALRHRARREERGEQASRGRQRVTSDADGDAAIKAKVFADALARVGAVGERPPKASTRRGARIPVTAARYVAPPPRPATADPAKAPGKRRRARASAPRGGATTRGQGPSLAHRKAKQGAIAALGRRTQARRDARR